VRLQFSSTAGHRKGNHMTGNHITREEETAAAAAAFVKNLEEWDILPGGTYKPEFTRRIRMLMEEMYDAQSDRQVYGQALASIFTSEAARQVFACRHDESLAESCSMCISQARLAAKALGPTEMLYERDALWPNHVTARELDHAAASQARKCNCRHCAAGLQRIVERATQEST
jgi:hypothetical protein